MSWKSVALGDICSIVNGGTPKSAIKEYWGGSLNWITPKEMGKLTSREISSTERKITTSGLKNSSAKLLPVNSVILSSRAPIGHLAVNKELMATNQGCKGLIPADNLDYEYLYYFLLHSKKLLNDMGSGATFKELSGSKLATVEIPLPLLSIQKKLVKKLDTIFADIDSAITAVDKNIKEVENGFNSFLTASLSQLSANSEHAKLETLCERITVGFVGKMKNEYVPNGIPFLRSQNIRPYALNMSDVMYINEDFHKLIGKSTLKSGDVAIVRTGYPGTAAVIPQTLGVANCSDLVIFTPRKELNPYFLELFFNSPYGKSIVLGKLVGAAQKHFNVSSAKKVSFPVVELNLQNEFVENARNVQKHFDNLKLIYTNKLSLLKVLKNSILHKAFIGELVKD